MRWPLLALTILALAAQAAQAQAQSAGGAVQAAVAAAVHGSVQVASTTATATDRPVGQQIGSGTPIYIGDEIATGPGAGLQIMLLDQTIVTLGQNARLSVDEMFYDPAAGSGKLAVNIKDGAFRFVTGKIAQAHPESVTVQVPLPNIGIRGTIVGGGPQPAAEGQPQQPSSNGYFVMLLGPGPANDTAAKNGAIGVTAANTTQMVNRPGWAVDLTPGQPPSAPHVATQAQLATMARVSAAPAPPQQQQQQAAAPSGPQPEQGQPAPAPVPDLPAPPPPPAPPPAVTPVVVPVPPPPTPLPSPPPISFTNISAIGHVTTTDGEAKGQSVSGVVPTFDSSGNLIAFSGMETSGDGGCANPTCTFSHQLSGGTSTTVYSDQYILIGKWSGGAVTDVLDSTTTGTNVLGAGSAFFGGGQIVPAAALPTNGTATFSTLAGGAVANGNGVTGTVNGAQMTVYFGATPAVTYSIDFTLGATYNLSSRTSINLNSINSSFKDTNPLITTGAANVTGASVAGALFGSGGQRAGLVFGVTNSNSAANIAGVAALKR